MDKIELVVDSDHLERIARATALTGLSELIWNALDAEASSVNVVLEPSPIAGEEGIVEIRVIDDGHGMTPSEAERGFGNLGGSWKARAERSKHGAVALHGRAGQGRFKAFALGDRIQWDTVSTTPTRSSSTHLLITRESLKRCLITQQVAESPDSGTTVVVQNLRSRAQRLADSERLFSRLTAVFALRIREQPHLSIRINDRTLDPESLESHVVTYDLDLETHSSGPLTLTVIEWSQEVDRALHLCDAAGSSLYSIAPGIQAPTFNFTAYACWEEFKEQEELLGITEISHDMASVIGLIRDELRAHFRRRSHERDSEVIRAWQEEGVYPYDSDPPSLTSSETAERQVFDLVALTYNAANPSFARSETPNKRVTLRLLQEAVGRSPERIHRILSEVTRLDEQRLEELASLLEHTKLSKIISATHQVSDRLNLLHSLDVLLFDLPSETGERKHLHPILEGELWLFGDHFDSAISERGLTNVLRQHIQILGRDDLVGTPVTKEDGTLGRIDLMLSARVAGRGTRKAEHLIVELKGPKTVLGMSEFSQIQEYITAVLEDPRFYNDDVRWEFWLLGNSLDASLARLVRNTHGRDPGVVDSGDNYTVWIMPWARLIDEHQRRLLFMKEALEHNATEASSIEYLQKTHAKYLPESLGIGV